MYKPRPSRKLRGLFFYCQKNGHHVDERPMLKQAKFLSVFLFLYLVQAVTILAFKRLHNTFSFLTSFPKESNP